MAYDKQTWDMQSHINPTRMNHIEDGIASAGNSVLATINLAGESKTAEWYLNSLYSEISSLNDVTICEGFVLWNGIVYRLSRVTSAEYTFATVELNQAGTAMENTVVKASASGSKFLRTSIDLSTNAVSHSDMTSTSFTNVMTFYGKTINE